MLHRNLLNTQELLTLVNDAQPSIQEPVIEYDEPLVKFVNQTLKYALETKASDIHIEPFASYCRIRFRLDGILKTISEIPKILFNRFVTRLKVLAQLNIAEKRLPQDGRFHFMVSETKIDVRMSICPTLYGEKIVLRLLNTHCKLLQIDQLGLTCDQQRILHTSIARPHGLILVVGPTGSGKTITLYSALKHLNSENKNICSIEDPIEIELAGINQVNIQPKIGLTFRKALRTFLRQDPDVIMIGEIRDKETAKIALQAAQTGHLVFSTLHCHNAYEAFVRLQSLGLALHDISQAVNLIVAQRLVRKTILEGGRTGIFECLPMSADLSEQLRLGMTRISFCEYMQKNNYATLQQSADFLVQTKQVDSSEIRRVLGHVN